MAQHSAGTKTEDNLSRDLSAQQQGARRSEPREARQPSKLNAFAAAEVALWEMLLVSSEAKEGSEHAQDDPVAQIMCLRFCIFICREG